MFYLTNFCRICVKSGDEMQDIDAEDHDTVKFSDKLRRIYKRMVINKEDHSKQICNDCVEKLRVSYMFQKMCAKSDQIFQQYLQEITSIHSESKFVNSELRVTIVPIPRIQIKCEGVEDHPIHENRRLSVTRTLVNLGKITYDRSAASTRTTNIHPRNIKLRRRLKQEASFRISDAYKERLRRLCQESPTRITKEQRCTILKSLLSKSDNNRNIQLHPRRISKKQREHIRNWRRETFRPRTRVTKQKKTNLKVKGGLRDLLGFIKNYDFGYNIDENNIEQQCDKTALDQLETFSRTFFYNDFQDYRDTILSVVNDTDSSDEDDMFGPYDEEEDRLLWPECIQLNNNCSSIRVKKELMHFGDGIPRMSIKMEVYAEPPETTDTPDTMSRIKQEQHDGPNDDDEEVLLPSEFVQTCYGDQPIEQTQQHHLKSKINLAFEHFMNNMKSKLPTGDGQLQRVHSNASRSNSRISVIPEASTSTSLSSLDLLTRLTNSTSSPMARGASKQQQQQQHQHKSMTPYHMKCRTRGNPFINPQLMQQFQTRTFKCDTCNRCFKSPGYLHSHCTKMGH